MPKCDMSMHRSPLAALAISLVVIGSGVTGAAQTSPRDSDKPLVKPRQGNEGYCGIYCLYGALRALRVGVTPESLLKPEYIGSVEGSTLAELRRAAEEKGACAVPVGKLTTRSLAECPAPVILHVKSQATSKEYNHYELFLGMDGRKAKLLNPPESIRLVPFHELPSRWDGNALIVSAKPIDLSKVFARARKRFMLWTVATLGMVLSIHLARRWPAVGFFQSRRALVPLSLAQSSGLVLLALLWGLLYHFAGDEGLLANAKATEGIQQAHAGSFIPKATASEVRDLLRNGAVFIDARFRRDYQGGHLRGAISIPVDANDAQRRKMTASLARSSKIVVYCQSKACQFAEKVAVDLKDGGFSDVVVYRGGWVDWVAKNGKKNEELKS